MGLHRPHVGRERRRVPQRQRHAPRGRVRHRDAPSASVPSRHVFARLDDSILVHRGDVPVGKTVRRRRRGRHPRARRRLRGDRGATTATGDPPLSAAPSGTISRRAWRRRGVFASVTPPPSFRSRDTQRRRRCGAWPRSRRTVRSRARAGRVGRDHSAQTRGAGFGERGDGCARAARAARAGSSAKEAALRAAASARLKLGDVRGYCELSRDVGDWDAALAAAPAVSLAFWAELASSRADALAKDDDGNLDDVVHLRLAAGRVDAAVEALQGAGRDDDAFLVACTADEGLLRAPPRDEETSGAETTTGRTGATTTGTTDAPSIDGAPTSASSATSTPARERSRSSTLENVSTLAAALPSTLGRPRNSLPAIGAARGNAALSPLPPLGGKTPLAPGHPADGHARRDDSASGRVERGAVRREEGDAVRGPRPARSVHLSAVRAAQGATRLARGDAVGSASCALSVGDAVGAARALVRGAQIEMAAALMLSVPRAAGDFPDAPRALLCERATALREWDVAFRSAVDVADEPTRAWRLQLLAARRLAEGDDVRASERFAEKCAAARGGAAPGTTTRRPRWRRRFEGTRRRRRRRRCARRRASRPRRAWDGAALERLLSALAVVGTGTNATAYGPHFAGGDFASVFPLGVGARLGGVHPGATLPLSPREIRAQIHERRERVPAIRGVHLPPSALAHARGVPRGGRGGFDGGGGGGVGIRGDSRRGGGVRRARRRRWRDGG